MNAKWLVAAAFLLGSASGCAYSIKTSSDYNRQVSFSKYRTFFMVKGNSSGDPAVDALLASDVVTALTSKGWTEVPKGEGEAAVVIHAATTSAHTNEAFYNGWGGWQWRGFDSATTFEQGYRVGTAVVTIFDADTKQAIWRGSAADAIGDSSRHAAAKVRREAVARMFDKLPVVAQTAPPAAAANATSPARIEAPEILFSASPAVLIRIDGEPVYRDVDGTGLQRIVNTRPLILRDESGTLYLRILNGWMEAYSLEGWWSVAGVPPEDGDAALRKAAAAKEVDLMDGADAHGGGDSAPLTDERAPAVYIATMPAALVVTDGSPQFAAVAGTSLEYIANTTSKVFREPTDQQLYLLLSGRWFRAWTTSGPWQVIPDGQLPADIAQRAD
jgi:hypothetical protein